MQNVILVIHLLLALLLIGAVLLQRSEGGALGIGGGGNVMSGRGAATALQKATWGLAAAFIVTSLALAFLAIDAASDRGLGLGGQPGVEEPAGEAAPAESGPPALDLDDLGIKTDKGAEAPAGGGAAPAEESAPAAAEAPAGEAAPSGEAAPAGGAASAGETAGDGSGAPDLDVPSKGVPELPDAN